MGVKPNSAQARPVGAPTSHTQDAFIQLNGRELLTHAGKISQQMAKERSTLEFEKFWEIPRQKQHDTSLKELEKDSKRIDKG